MDLESYDSLFLKIRDTLSSSNLNRKAFIASHFSSTLVECNICISRSLELATKLLDETNDQVNKLCNYVDNAIILLQMLSDFVKNVLESAAMACCRMKNFPTTTGHIILTVFMHCKDSEFIYGHHLKLVQTQLKNLFRTCHELQLTYLVTLEKHFIFDLTEKQEQDVLIEAVNINMKIGEVVQALDIKTMAEQWKAYTVICEKYSNFLLDNNVYNKCSQLFATIIMDNIKTAMESECDNKNTLRSLKIANFTIKILSRVSNILKQAITNNYIHVVELMEYIYMHNPTYLELSADKTQQFIDLMSTNILTPTDSLCNILLQDERFLDYVYKIDAKNLETDAFLGHITLIISVIKAMIQQTDDQVFDLGKRKMIDCIYRILPLGHCWFNMRLRHNKHDSGSEKYFSMYEYLLVHVVALASTFTSEQYAALEKYMFEATMSIDCYSAIFSSNLWILLTRITSDQLTSNTLFCLVNIYQKLEQQRTFPNSPQEVHLSYLIGKLFELASSDDKKTMWKQFQPQNTLWSILKVSNLPEPMRRNVEAAVCESLKTSSDDFFESQNVTDKELTNLIQIMRIAATCTFFEYNDTVHHCVVRLWSNACQRSGYSHSEHFDTAGSVWYFQYLEALVTLTDCTALKLNSANVGKILHIMSTLLNNCNEELVFILFHSFCKLTLNSCEDENQHVIDNIFKDTCKVLLRNVETCVKPYLLSILSKYRYTEQFHEIISTAFSENESLKKEFDINCYGDNYCNSFEWKQQLISAGHFEYIHKCRNLRDDVKESDCGSQSMNSRFDLGGFLFDDEVEEPSRKKAKLDMNDTDSIIENLEKNTSLLCQMQHTTLCDYRKRITDVIDKLKNIVS